MHIQAPLGETPAPPHKFILFIFFKVYFGRVDSFHSAYQLLYGQCSLSNTFSCTWLFYALKEAHVTPLQVQRSWQGSDSKVQHSSSHKLDVIASTEKR